MVVCVRIAHFPISAQSRFICDELNSTIYIHIYICARAHIHTHTHTRKRTRSHSQTDPTDTHIPRGSHAGANSNRTPSSTQNPSPPVVFFLIYVFLSTFTSAHQQISLYARSYPADNFKGKFEHGGFWHGEERKGSKSEREHTHIQK